MASIVKAENLGKHYTLGGLHPGYATLRESLAGLIAGKRKSAPGAIDPVRSFWALRDVNFEMDAGETLGIVGRNGAGKSTLLKILCRITKPTTGRARLEGRVGSLLEVGTGFHPDLTGRENIFLNGAILGMSRAEIRSKFDEIVSFSEVERHLDTPVKFYSSGMYVRLAFSVAAHLDTEILIMDEVLAVGDTAFQQKCLDKMHRIRSEGRTIFFVSHNMAAVTRLCRRAIHLRDGRIVAEGAAQSIVADYMRAYSRTISMRTWDAAEAPGDETARLCGVRLLAEDGSESATFDERSSVGVEVTFTVSRADAVITPRIELTNEEGVMLFGGKETGTNTFPATGGTQTRTAWIPGALLVEGGYGVHISLESEGAVTHAQARDAVTFRISDRKTDDPHTFAARHANGVIRSPLAWSSPYAASGNGTDAAVDSGGGDIFYVRDSRQTGKQR